MRTCPECGKEKIKFVDRICLACYAKGNTLVKGFKDIKVEMCNECKRYKYKAKFIENLNKVIKAGVVFDENATIAEFESYIDRKDAIISLKGKFDRKQITEEYTVPINLQKITCKKCGKKGSQYFEGTLQIRGNDLELVKDFISEELRAIQKKAIYCNKIEATKHGLDYLITNKNYVQELAKKVHNHFGFELKVNAQLFSHNRITSKDIFRVNALVRLPDFARDDVIEVDKKVILITSIKGSHIYGLDLERNKSANINMKGKEYEILSQTNYESEVMQDKPNVMVLHPETYQSTLVENAEKQKVGDKVKIIIVKGKIYVI